MLPPAQQRTAPGCDYAMRKKTMLVGGMNGAGIVLNQIGTVGVPDGAGAVDMVEGEVAS